MAKITLEFENNLIAEEFTEITEFLTAMYSSVATIDTDYGGELRNVEDLTEDDYGKQVMLESGDAERFEGILEGSFQVPRSPLSRVLVVDGFAHKLNYGVVRVL